LVQLDQVDDNVSTDIFKVEVQSFHPVEVTAGNIQERMTIVPLQQVWQGCADLIGTIQTRARSRNRFDIPPVIAPVDLLKDLPRLFTGKDPPAFEPLQLLPQDSEAKKG
jgi:hypothetical protein